jgi:hypothetical protein
MHICPTLSPFATCGDRGFKFDEKYQVLNEFLLLKNVANLPNVAKGRILRVWKL